MVFRAYLADIAPSTILRKAAWEVFTSLAGPVSRMKTLPGGSKTPQPNAMLSGAILESGQGNVFIRLTGPAKLVKTSQTAFRKMVEAAMSAK